MGVKEKGRYRMIRMHKDKAVAQSDKYCNIQSILQSEELPLGILSKNKFQNNETMISHRFRSWLSHRTIPNERAYREALSASLGCSFTDAMLKSMIKHLYQDVCEQFKKQCKRRYRCVRKRIQGGI